MHHLQHITELGSLLKRHGARHVIIAPGSRNAPLTQLFTSDKAFHCHSIVDERSAAYVALGMARQLREPVVVVTTSGTAVLNLSPAIAEAFHQRIPLLVLTADRPGEVLSQFNNQRTDQRAPYFNHSKGFFELPAVLRSPEELEKGMESLEKLFREAMNRPGGPVHVNLPLNEPLYEKLPDSVLPDPVLTDAGPGRIEQDPDIDLQSTLELKGKKVLILAGMGLPDIALQNTLEELVSGRKAVVVAENISNLASEYFISTPELVLSGASKVEQETLNPDLLIAFGLQVVSKRMRLKVQSLDNVELIELPEDGDVAAILKQMSIRDNLDDSYGIAWKEIEQREQNRVAARLSEAPFGSLSALVKILDAVPADSVVHLGNSSTIRFSQLIPARTDLSYFSNRGTSGIDGSLSGAVGAAMVSDKQHLLVLGDLSFVYDSNALWNKDFPENLKIVVLNDGGGGIFRLLDGPGRMDFFEEFSVTHHPVSMELLSGAFGRDFGRASDFRELDRQLKGLFAPGKGISVLEVDCTKSDNSRIFKELFSKQS